MTILERQIIKNMHKRGNIHKMYGKWCIKTVDVEKAIQEALWDDSRWLIELSIEERNKIQKVLDGMIKRGIVRYSKGYANRGLSMILEKKYWELYKAI